MSRYGIETTQHVQINYDIASAGSRVLAYIIDVILISIYTIVIISLWTAFDRGDSNSTWIPTLIAGLPSLFYRFILEVSWGGYTLGKWLLGIRVVKVDGTRATFGSYLMRWMIGLIEIPISSGSVALVTILLNGKGQRLGDIAGNTCVIRERKKVKLDETLFAEVEAKYEVIYENVSVLSDKDIGIIREVIAARSEYDQSTWFVMMQRTRKLIEEKTGVQDESKNALDFLETVIKDYNAIHS